jgi:hypothetical protein
VYFDRLNDLRYREGSRDGRLGELFKTLFPIADTSKSTSMLVLHGLKFDPQQMALRN